VASNSPLYPFLELEVGSVPFGPNFPQLYFGEPSSGFTPGPRSPSFCVSCLGVCKSTNLSQTTSTRLVRYQHRKLMFKMFVSQLGLTNSPLERVPPWSKRRTSTYTSTMVNKNQEIFEVASNHGKYLALRLNQRL
jgi:hypothetical protein